ncbi:MAG: hypothetical protein FWD14_03635 [Treponema sp.]|nr:hypothetical protein [Treponema sp.]
MNTRKDKQIFLVLVPHRDVRIELQKYSNKLIKEGLTGVYTFPLVVPLVSLLKPLKNDELRQIAITLRKVLGKEKITTAEFSSTLFPADTDTEEMFLFGPKLGFNIPIYIFENVSDKLKKHFSPLIAGLYLQPRENKQFCALKTESSVPPCEILPTSAAALANLHWQPINLNGKNSYKWKIDKLCWLPKNK